MLIKLEDAPIECGNCVKDSNWHIIAIQFDDDNIYAAGARCDACGNTVAWMTEDDMRGLVEGEDGD